MTEASLDPTRQNLPALDPSAGMDPQGTGEQNDFPTAESHPTIGSHRPEGVEGVEIAPGVYAPDNATLDEILELEQNYSEGNPSF